MDILLGVDLYGLRLPLPPARAALGAAPPPAYVVTDVTARVMVGPPSFPARPRRDVLRAFKSSRFSCSDSSEVSLRRPKDLPNQVLNSETVMFSL